MRAHRRRFIDFLLTVFGVVLIVEGIPWFLSPSGGKDLVRQILDLPDSALRSLGLLAMLAGLLLVRFGTG